MHEFDLVVIGSGPAGYTGAIRAAQLGMKVACIETRKTLGGTCLNVGCIPSKSLLHFSEKYEDAKEHFTEIGIDSEIKLNLDKMLAKKNQIVADLCKGIEGLFIKNKITKFTGKGQIINPHTVEIDNGSGKQQVTARNILIATGSEIINLPNIIVDEEVIVSSTGALNLTRVPKTMIVIGGGVIGLELGSVWRRLGTRVTIVEFTSGIAPSLDKEIAAQFTKMLQKQGMEFRLRTKVLSTEKKQGTVSVKVQDIPSGKEEQMSADIVLVAVGRAPNTKGLGLEQLGIKLDSRGCIEVNNHFCTSIANIYAVGDVIKGPMLAHKAEEEAVAAIEIMAGLAGHVNYNTIPNVIYTHPEVAVVGKTEEELKEAGISYKVGKFPFSANSRARAINATEGLVKILADSNNDKILGAHIIGADAGTLIAEVVTYMEFSASSEDIARTCHAHPTLNEAIKEAALAVEKRTINL